MQWPADAHPGPGRPVRERVLIFKDTQIAPALAADQSQVGGKWAFVGSTTPDLRPLAPDSAPAQNGAPAVEGVKFFPGGECAPAASDGVPTNKWLFTVNGRKQPRLVADGKSREVWRMANESPTVSYHLSLIPLAQANDPSADGRLDRQDFIMLAKHGAAAPSGAAGEKEILLMPGARIEILASKLPKGEFALVTEGLRTGDDAWPRVILATFDIRAASAEVAPPHEVMANMSVTAGPIIDRALPKPPAALPLPSQSLANLHACDPLNGRERVIYFVKNPN
ncbi:MAG TPA: hypothetical protein VMU18_13175, partial [Rhodoblastus sp.]|nr:hypothetical protein [Rhodoblastus sp.]